MGKFGARSLVEATIVVVNVRALAQRAYASDGWLTRDSRQTLSTMATAAATAAAGLPMTGESSEQVSERASVRTAAVVDEKVIE